MRVDYRGPLDIRIEVESEAVFDEIVPESFMEGIEEYQEMTFREYTIPAIVGGIEYDMDNNIIGETPLSYWLPIGRRIGLNYGVSTNFQAWADHFGVSIEAPIEELPIEE